jgi:hypothetical protein
VAVNTAAPGQSHPGGLRATRVVLIRRAAHAPHLVLLLLLLDGELGAELAKGANLLFALLFTLAFCLAI